MKKLKVNKLLIHRIIWAPTLMQLKVKHFITKCQVKDAQKLVYHMIELHGHKNAGRYIKHLESLLEKIDDLDKKIEELWSGQALKKG